MYASLRGLPPDGDYPTPEGAGEKILRLEMLSNAVRLWGVQVLIETVQKTLTGSALMFKNDGV